jgi:putative ABC transport system permease protein
MSPFKLAYLSLTRKKISSFIALASIAISVATSGVLLRLYLLTSSRFSTIAAGGDAIIGAKAGGIDILLGALNLEGDYPGFLPQKLFESLQAQQKVVFEDGAASEPNFLKSVIPFLYFAKLGPYRVIGTDEHFFTRPRSEDNLRFSSGGIWSKPTSLVIGSALAESRGLKVGSSEKIVLWAGRQPILNPQPLSFEVSGILQATHTAWDYAAFVPYQFAQSVFSQINLGETTIWQNQVLNYFLIYLDPNGRSKLESLINKRTVGQIAWINEEKTHLEKLTGTGQKIGFLITALVMLLGGLSVTAMMTTRFEAMNVQIAVVRAIGYTRSQISFWLFFEGLLLGLSATFIGAILDLVCFPIVKNLLGDSIPNLEWMQSSIWQSSLIWLISIIATIAAIFLPMLRLVNQNIHDQLKGL